MRIAFASDFQLGAGADYGAQPGDRLADQERILHDLLHEANARRVRALVFGGDAFEHRRPAVAELAVFRRWLDEADGAGIDVFGVVGNHDVTGPDAPTSLDVFGNVFNGERADRFLHSTPGVSLVASGTPHVDQQTVAICALPWAHPASLRAKDPDADLATKLVEVAAGLRASADRFDRRVLVAHWALSGTSLPNGLPTSALREAVLPLDDLRGQGWDLIVGGHVHKAQRIVAGGPGTISFTDGFVVGSPYVCDFGEANVEHGFWVWDSDGIKGEKVEFVPLADRPFVTLERDASDVAGDSYELDREELAGAVVRVRVRGSADDLALCDFDALRRELYEAGAYKVYAIEPIPDANVRARVEIADADDVSPEEALELWLDASEDDLGRREGNRERLFERHNAFAEEIR